MKRLINIALVASAAFLCNTSQAQLAPSTNASLPPAQPAAAATNAAKAPLPKFKVKSGVFRTQEEGVLITTILEIDGYNISFLPPPNCTRSIQPEQQKVTFASSNSQMALSVRVVTDFGATDDNSFRQRLQTLYPEGEVSPVMLYPSASGMARCCDVKRVTKSRAILTTRHAIIPFVGGVLEVVFTADAASFEDQRAAMILVMNTIKAEVSYITE